MTLRSSRPVNWAIRVPMKRWTGSVEPPPPHFVLLLPFVGDRVSAVLCRDGLVKRRLQGGHERNLRKRRPQLPHRFRVRRIVSRCHVRQRLHRVEQFVIDDPHAAQLAGEHGFETDGRHFFDRRQASVVLVRQLIQTHADGGRVVADACLHFLPVASDLDETVRVGLLADPINPAARKLLTPSAYRTADT